MLRRLATPVLIAVVALSGCRSSKVEPAFLSEEAVMLDLPLVRQDELYNCGLAAISALCQYWDVELPEQQRILLAKLASDEKGLSGKELRDALEARGMETFLFRGTLDREDTGVYKQIDAGRPLVVMLSPDGKAHHYCLVLGYDEPRDSLVLLDPARGEVVRPVKQFDKDWQVCQRFTLLACPKDAPKNAAGSVPTGPAGTVGGETPVKEKRP